MPQHKFNHTPNGIPAEEIYEAYKNAFASHGITTGTVRVEFAKQCQVVCVVNELFAATEKSERIVLLSCTANYVYSDEFRPAKTFDPNAKIGTYPQYWKVCQMEDHDAWIAVIHEFLKATQPAEKPAGTSK